MHPKLQLVIGSMAIALSASAGVSSAGLFSTISYDQSVFATRNFPGESLSQSLIGSTLPVSQTITVGDGGPASQAKYSFTDNGSVATFDIYVVASVDGIQQTAGEGTDVTNFEFGQPVSYDVIFRTEVSSGLTGSGRLGLTASGSQAVFGSGTVINSSYQSDGVLNAGITYDFSEIYELDNNIQPNTSAMGNGTSSVIFTFTAVPEPSSLCLSAVLCTAVLGRRRRVLGRCYRSACAAAR